MGWHRVAITGGSATEREGHARVHSQQFWAAWCAFDGGDDAYMVQHWSPLKLELYFSPAAIAMGGGLFQCAGAVPCEEPAACIAHFYAGSVRAADLWGSPAKLSLAAIA